MITEDIGNSTVALGREATLKCVVTHLSDYKVSIIYHLSSMLNFLFQYETVKLLCLFVQHKTKVAWVHIDRQMILTIGRHVITRIPR